MGDQGIAHVRVDNAAWSISAGAIWPAILVARRSLTVIGRIVTSSEFYLRSFSETQSDHRQVRLCTPSLSEQRLVTNEATWR